MRTSVALALGIFLLGSGAAQAQTYAIYGAERYFRVEWEAGQSARRGPVVSGYVYNDYGRAVERMQLSIEGLDGSGAVVSTTIGYVLGTVPGWNRAYFEIPVPAGAAAYKVRVLSFNWVGQGR
jgi:hypothetical protein